MRASEWAPSGAETPNTIQQGSPIRIARRESAAPARRSSFLRHSVADRRTTGALHGIRLFPGSSRHAPVFAQLRGFPLRHQDGEEPGQV